MNYTILSARYANAGNTAAVLQTVEAGDVLVSQVDTPVEWESMLQTTVSPYVPVVPTKDQLIEAVLAPHKVPRLLVQLTLKNFEREAKEYAAANPPVTVAQVIANLRVNNKTFKVCEQLEAAAKAIEDAP